MSSLAYEGMKMQINRGNYTEVEAKQTITRLCIQKMITGDEYNTLMSLATQLNPNSNDGEIMNHIIALDERITEMETRITKIEDALKESGEVTEPEEPEQPTEEGTITNPITAYAGMVYYPGKYYKDPSDGNTYLCMERADVNKGEGIRLYYVPSQLVNIYFTIVQ